MQKHSLTLGGHRTSISLEPEFWAELRVLAERQGVPLQKLIEEVDRTRAGNLSSALRLRVLKELKTVPGTSFPRTRESTAAS